MHCLYSLKEAAIRVDLVESGDLGRPYCVLFLCFCLNGKCLLSKLWSDGVDEANGLIDVELGLS